MDDASSTTLSAGEDSPAPISNPNSLGARNVAHVAHGYGNLDALERTPPLVITRGKGVSIIDEEGRDYIEGVAGMWCANFGFSESALVDAAIEQFRVLPYYHSLIDKTTEPMGRLAERLKASTHVPMARVFFANSGSEANDTLVKLTWYYHNAIGKPEKKKIISRFMGFHGVTCGAASVTGIPQMHTDFDLPVNDLFFKTDCPHFYRYGEPGESEEDYATRLAANLEELIVTEGPETVAAFFAEPVMGGGGCIVPPKTYFEKVQAVLDKYEVLFFADEVITGSGRTGNWLGSETFNIRPDGLSLAKGLASAYQPISAVMINQKIYDAMLAQSRKLGFFAHAFTTTGHPVAVAVALRCQELMEERDVLDNVRRVGGLLQERIRGFADHPLVGTTRGVGMMAAIELVADKETRRSFDPSFGVKAYAVDRAREHGLIIRSALAGDSLAFAPPLVMTEAEMEEMMRRFTAALDDTTRWVEENGLQTKQAA